MKANLEQLRKGSEFIGYARQHGAEVRPGHGSHNIVRTEKGMAVVPVHAGDLGKGLRCKIVKAFLAIGLVLSALVVVSWP